MERFRECTASASLNLCSTTAPSLQQIKQADMVAHRRGSILKGRRPHRLKAINRRDLLGTATTLSLTQLGDDKSALATTTGSEVDTLAAVMSRATFQKSKARRKQKRQEKSVENVSVSKFKLASNLHISKVIKGCWQLDGEHRGEAEGDHTFGSEATRDFGRFLTAGISTWDTADLYGPSESIIGQYLRLYPEKRSAVQILTKLSFTGDDMKQLSPDLLRFRIRAAMRRMAVDHIDLLQVHWDDYRQKGYLDVLKHLAEMRANGDIKHIGLTNFNTSTLLQVLDAEIPILSNQVQYSVLDRRPDLYMADVCQRKKVALIAYGVLAGGFLSEKYLGKASKDVKLDTLSKMRHATLLPEIGNWKVLQRVSKALRAVALRHSVSASAVAIRWVLQQSQVAAAIIGARNSNHIKDLLSLETFKLSEVDMLDIDAAYETVTQPTTDVYDWERGGIWADTVI